MYETCTIKPYNQFNVTLIAHWFTNKGIMSNMPYIRVLSYVTDGGVVITGHCMYCV